MEKPSGLRRGCSSLFIQGFDSPLHLYQIHLIMESKKEPIYYKEDDDEIIHPDYRPLFQSEGFRRRIESSDDYPQEESCDSDLTIVCAFISTVVAIFIILLFILFFFS